jgi:tetratricopeptide (TPR) repeat protein
VYDKAAGAWRKGVIDEGEPAKYPWHGYGQFKMLLRTRPRAAGVASMKALQAIALLLLTPACIWDSDTLRDELQSNPDSFDLITGQFPHHGKGYYEHRVRRLTEELKQHPEDVIRRNDLGVALLKLGRFDESLAEFERIEEIEPGRYETLANLGVLYKKRGEFDKAVDRLERALAMRPEGHLGIGDYYVRLARYLQQQDAPPQKSFLGYSYERFTAIGGPRAEEFELDFEMIYERMPKLVEADRTFADGMLVLGDVFARQRDLNFALWAYVRAEMLGHPNPSVVRARIDAIFAHWKEAQAFRPIHVEDPAAGVAAIRSDLERAGQWIQAFERVETELVALHGEIDFNTVTAEMERRGIQKFVPPNRGVSFSPVASLRSHWLVWVLLVIGMTTIALAAVKFLRTQRRRLRAA